MSITVIDRADAFRKALDSERVAGRTVGLVPTMGYLHAGHASLIRQAAAACDVVAVTLFVNPLQFAPNEDLAAYPRDPAGDQETAEAAGAGYLFAPSNDGMFPAPPLTTVSVAGLSETLDGRSRPGHTARLVLTGEGGGEWLVAMGGGEPNAVPDVTVTAHVVDWCRRVGERIAPDALPCRIDGDHALAADLIQAASAFATL